MDRHLNRENKNDLMTQLMSPNKKMKMETAVLKQETGQEMMTGVSQYPMVSAGNGASLWGGFPLYTAQQQPSVQPTPGFSQAVYPGMVPQYLHPNMSELQTVMKIGECSIKPLHQ